MPHRRLCGAIGKREAGSKMPGSSDFHSCTMPCALPPNSSGFQRQSSFQMYSVRSHHPLLLPPHFHVNGFMIAPNILMSHQFAALREQLDGYDQASRVNQRRGENMDKDSINSETLHSTPSLQATRPMDRTFSPANVSSTITYAYQTGHFQIS